MDAILVNDFVNDLTQLTASRTTIPQSDSNDTLLIRVTHAAVTHVDLLYAQGLHQNNRRHVKPPFILGTEFAGVVAEAPSTSGFGVGTRVFGSGLGSYANFIRVPETHVREVPSQWTNAGACAVGVSGVVSYGSLLKAARLQAGESVLVLGATGGLGAMAIQIAKAKGCYVIATAGSQEKCEKAKEWGADAVVDYHDVDWERQVQQLSPAREGVDVVYDAIGAVQSSIKTLKYGGRVVIVGFAGRDGKIEELKMNRILLKAVTVVGYRFGEHGRRAPQEVEEIWTDFMKLVKAGKIIPTIYDQDYEGLASVTKALKDTEARKPWGRAVVRIADDKEPKKRPKL